MRARRLLALAVAVLAIVAPCSRAVAQESSVRAIVDALNRESVYASPSANPTLSPAESRVVSREIARKDARRIKVAIVSEVQASRAGGVTALANELDHRLGNPGTVFVTAGRRSWLVTTYSDTNAATGAVQQAFNAHNTLVDQLREAVDGVAAVDPSRGTSGRSSTPNSPPNGSTSSDGSSFVWIVIAAAIGLPVLLWVLVIARRRWRAGSEARETFEDDLADARQQLVSLSDDIRDLDVDESMPAADPAGKRAYEDALVQYQRAERLLGEKANVRRLARAGAALAEGRRLMDEARTRLEAA